METAIMGFIGFRVYSGQKMAHHPGRFTSCGPAVTTLRKSIEMTALSDIPATLSLEEGQGNPLMTRN